MHYGDRSNIELVTHQGFFVPNNPNSYTTIDMALLYADKLREQKAEVLKKHELPEYVFCRFHNLLALALPCSP